MNEVKLAGSGFICAAWKKIIEGPLDSRRTLVFRCDHPYGHKGKHLDRVLLVSWPECESDPECRPRNEWNLIGSRAPHPDHAAVEAMAQALEEWPAFCAEAESHINGVITVAAVHGVTYDGPNWTTILNQTKAALATYRATCVSRPREEGQ